MLGEWTFDENSTAPMISDYKNPFYKCISPQDFFPEKLKNVTGYPIRLGKIDNYYTIQLVKFVSAEVPFEIYKALGKSCLYVYKYIHKLPSGRKKDATRSIFC